MNLVNTTGEFILAELTTFLGLRVAGFAAGNVALVLVWLGVAFLILREHRRLTGSQAEEGIEPN